MLKDISKSCINPFNKSMYKLLGIVKYKKPILTRSVQTIGHYMAICLRAGVWIEYNDLEKKEKVVKETSIITPALLIYVKKES